MEENTSRSIAFGLWVARHREKLHRWGRIVLICIDVLCIGLFLILLWIWFSHREQTQQIWENIPNSHLRTDQRQAPSPVTATNSVVVQHDDTSIDAAVTMTNSNERWAVFLTYEFLLGGQSVGTRTVVLAPEESYIATAIHVPWTSDTPSADVRITDVRWKKIAQPENLPTTSWQFGDVAFDTTRLADGTNTLISQLRVSVINAGAYGYLEPEVVVLLKNSSAEVVAIGTISLNELRSLEKRDLLFSWPTALPDSLTADIAVQVNRISPEKRSVHDNKELFIDSKKSNTKDEE